MAIKFCTYVATTYLMAASDRRYSYIRGVAKRVAAWGGMVASLGCVAIGVGVLPYPHIPTLWPGARQAAGWAAGPLWSGAGQAAGWAAGKLYTVTCPRGRPRYGHIGMLVFFALGSMSLLSFYYRDQSNQAPGGTP